MSAPRAREVLSLRRMTTSKILASLLLLLAACGVPAGSGQGADGSDPVAHPAGVTTPTPMGRGVVPPDPNGKAADPRPVFQQVDPARLQVLLETMTGGAAVTIDGADQHITERWSVAGKELFRAWYKQYFSALGIPVNEQTFAIPNLVGETQGHNVEAVLPGTSKDTLVIITHYDTVGIAGHEKDNPGADDAGSGLAMMLEAARIFAAIPNRKLTVRFVGADYEEISDDLDGDYAYVAALKKTAAAEGFAIVAASDGDQTGWSCWSENLCGKNAPAKNGSFQFIACSGDKKNYAYPELTAAMQKVLAENGSPMTIDTACDGSGDTDHYPFWEAGIPAYVIEEQGSENNPHYDDTGHDTMEKIDLDYLVSVARPQIALQAELAGVKP